METDKPQPASTNKPSVVAYFRKDTRFSLRNLLIFVVAFGAIGGFLVFRSFAAAPVVATIEAERMSLPAGATVVGDSAASGGQAVRFTKNGTATASISFANPVNSVTIMARGTKCKGTWPNMSLSIDGASILPTTAVSSSTWHGYSATPSVASGTHTLSLTAANTSGCGRYLYVDLLTFYGASTVTPPPTITFSATPTSVTAGGSSTLTWSSTNTTACSASGAWQGSEPLSGSFNTGALTTQSTYTLTCTGDGGSATSSATVNVTTSTNTNPLSVSVSGNHLVDASGNPLQLRGVNRSGTQYACVEGWGIFDGPTDATALGYIKAWGVNAVRVSLNEDCWLGINGVSATYSGANYQTAIENYVTRLNDQGFRVILDLHWNGPGTTQATDQLPMADRDHAPAFWQSVATAFKANPSVLFDLYNEPYPDSNHDTTAAWTCVRDGGTCPGVSFTAAGSQEMVNAIRNAGATNVIMVGGPQYAGVVDQWLAYKPSDPLNQLAASIHIYYNTPASPEWAPCDYQSCWTNTMAPLAQQVPIVMGEIGEHDCDYGLLYGTALSPQQPSLLDWADQHGISYLAWSWIANGGGNCAAEPSLVSDYNGTPTQYGVGIRNHLLSLPH